MFARSIALTAALLALSGIANAHGSHSNENPSSDWAVRHMQGKNLSLIWKATNRL
jgi:hypothetical protein